MGNILTMPDGTQQRAPHLSPADSDIMQAWLKQAYEDGDQFTFDLPLQGDRAPESMAVRELGEMWASLRAKRIDVVIERSDIVYVCEVKPRAGAMAVGQALMYDDLYRSQKSPVKKVLPMVITDHADEAVRALCKRLGVVIYETRTD